MKKYNIVLTGGPEGGKSTILKEISSKFENLDSKTRVVSVPEVASRLYDWHVPIIGGDNAFAYQTCVYRYQKLDYILMNYLASLTGDDKVIILYDRGIMDGRAYLDDDTFDKLVAVHKDDQLNLKDSYDLVINLQSSSNIDGLYNKETNPARYEEQDEAKFRDRRTSESWLNHRHFYNVMACKDFQEKIDNVLDIIDDFVNKEKEDTRMLIIDQGIGKSIVGDHRSQHISENELFLSLDKDDMMSLTTRKDDKNNESYVFQRFALTRQGKVIKEDKCVNKAFVEHLLNNKAVLKEVNREIFKYYNEKGEAFEMIFSEDLCFLRPLLNKKGASLDIVDDEYVTGICDYEDYYKMILKKGKERKLL